MGILVGYVRVSGENQRDNNSLPVQRSEIQSYCLRHGHTLFTILEDVESAEAADTRQGLQFALQAVYADLADGLIVHKLDRLARNVLDSEHIRLELKQRNKQLISIVDPVDTNSDSGKMVYQMLSAVAEFEKDRIKKRCAEGRERKRKNNGYIGGRPPYGYQAVGRNLLPCEREQAVIAKVCELREQGAPLAQIADQLNQDGIRTKKGKLWSITSVCRLLA
ncbi:MAG: recombinase family protein [Candidatus Obscuribacter sp.]|nr:recombinase family protein [Candidatus Obscuribacter sp.]MBK9279603.1 recombinase family protein [Candidatus Obscuribacter sp.]